MKKYIILIMIGQVLLTALGVFLLCDGSVIIGLIHVTLNSASFLLNVRTLIRLSNRQN